MTVNRVTETPLASAEIGDAVMDGAYAVEVSTWARRERVTVVMSAEEAKAFASEVEGAAIEAINAYRADNPPAEPFDAHTDAVVTR